MEYYKYYISTNTILTDTQQTVPYTRDPAPSGCYVRPTTTTVTCREDKVPYIFFALLASFTKKALYPFHHWGAVTPSRGFHSLYRTLGSHPQHWCRVGPGSPASCPASGSGHASC